MSIPSSRSTLSDSVLASIGAVAVEAAYLENTLIVMIWHLLELPQKKGHFITDDMHLKTLTDLFERLAVQDLQARYKDDAANFEKGKAEVVGQGSLTSRLREAIPKRNLAIHGYWFDWSFTRETAKSKPMVLRTTKKPKDGSLPKAQTPEYLDALAIELCQIKNDLDVFALLWLGPSTDADLGRHSFEPPSSPGKSSEPPLKEKRTPPTSRSRSARKAQQKPSQE